MQDLSSQLVVDAIGVQAGNLVADVCAAPGGKATALAALGACVIACDSHRGRAGLMEDNRTDLGAESMHVVAADGQHPPLRAGQFDESAGGRAMQRSGSSEAATRCPLAHPAVRGVEAYQPAA